jgi:hypothetical protein
MVWPIVDCFSLALGTITNPYLTTMLIVGPKANIEEVSRKHQTKAFFHS